MKTSALIIALICAAHFASATDTLQSRLDPLFDAPAWSNAHWGVLIVDLVTSEILYERNADKGFMPASNMKLYTTAAALDVLGPDYRYSTRVYSRGPISRNGTLRGDIIVKGSGDPSISWRYNVDADTTAVLQKWVEAIRKAGIRRIEGSVIGDDNAFDNTDRPGTWQVDYLADWYAAEASGLAINDNCWDVILRPGPKPGAPARLEPLIRTSYVHFINNMITTGPRVKKTDEPNITISRPTDGNDVTLSGTIQSDVAAYYEWGAVHNGTLYTVTMLEEALERAGITVTRGSHDIDDLPPAQAQWNTSGPRTRLIVEHQSPPLSRILAIINKPSQNFYAEQLFKTLGKERYGRGDYDYAERAVRDFITSAGAYGRQLQMADGSGLSRQDLVTPRMTIALLTRMYKSPHFKVFYDSLPIAGVDGTIRSRMKGTPAQGNVHAKTGYIGRVRALSGYARAASGHDIAFCTMANNYTVPTSLANDTQDSATLAIIELAGK